MGWAARANTKTYPSPKPIHAREHFKRPEDKRAWALLIERLDQRVQKHRVRIRIPAIVRTVFRYRRKPKES